MSLLESWEHIMLHFAVQLLRYMCERLRDLRAFTCFTKKALTVPRRCAKTENKVKKKTLSHSQQAHCSNIIQSTNSDHIPAECETANVPAPTHLTCIYRFSQGISVLSCSQQLQVDGSVCSVAAELLLWLVDTALPPVSAWGLHFCRLGRLPDSCFRIALRLLFSSEVSQISSYNTPPSPPLSVSLFSFPLSLSLAAPVHVCPLSYQRALIFLADLWCVYWWYLRIRITSSAVDGTCLMGCLAVAL